MNFALERPTPSASICERSISRALDLSFAFLPGNAIATLFPCAGCPCAGCMSPLEPAALLCAGVGGAALDVVVRRRCTDACASSCCCNHVSQSALEYLPYPSALSSAAHSSQACSDQPPSAQSCPCPGAPCAGAPCAGFPAPSSTFNCLLSFVGSAAIVGLRGRRVSFLLFLVPLAQVPLAQVPLEGELELELEEEERETLCIANKQTRAEKLLWLTFREFSFTEVVHVLIWL